MSSLLSPVRSIALLISRLEWESCNTRTSVELPVVRSITPGLVINTSYLIDGIRATRVAHQEFSDQLEDFAYDQILFRITGLAKTPKKLEFIENN